MSKIVPSRVIKMERSSPHTLLTSTTTTTMTVMLFLPLLLAQRPPINVRPRASILRRMPMFYGKRDPSLASPSSPVVQGASYSHADALSLIKDVPDFGPRLGDVHSLSHVLRGRSLDGTMPKTRQVHEEARNPQQSLVNAKRSGSGTRNSVMFSKLQAYINGLDNADVYGNFQSRGVRARPRFGILTNLSDKSGFEPVLGSGLVLKTSAERPQNQLERVKEALNNQRKGVAARNFQLSEEFEPEYIPFDFNERKIENIPTEYLYDGAQNRAIDNEVENSLIYFDNSNGNQRLAPGDMQW